MAETTTRMMWRFQIPKEHNADGKVLDDCGTPAESITMKRLTAGEEMDAMKRAGANPGRISYELALQALAKVDGVPVSIADASADVAWERLGPKGRSLAITAYNDIHSTTREQDRSFLGSKNLEI